MQPQPMVFTVKDHQPMIDVQKDYCLCLMAITQENSKLTATDIRGRQDHQPKVVAITLKTMLEDNKLGATLKGNRKPMVITLRLKLNIRGRQDHQPKMVAITLKTMFEDNNLMATLKRNQKPMVITLRLKLNIRGRQDHQPKVVAITLKTMLEDNKFMATLKGNRKP